MNPLDREYPWPWEEIGIAEKLWVMLFHPLYYGDSVKRAGDYKATVHRDWLEWFGHDDSMKTREE